MTSPHAPPDPAPRPVTTAAPPRRLYRDPHGPIGGVASGFAEYFEVDPVIARLLWVVALLSGVGLPAYVLCWLIVPKAPSWPPPDHGSRVGGAPAQPATWLSGVVIVALAAMIGSGLDGVGDYLLPAALIGFGIYLLNQRPLAAPLPGDGAAPPDGALAESPAQARRIVTPTVLSALAIGAGVLLALSAAGIAHVSVSTAAAAGLVLVGAGLVASAWLGRATGLVPVGLGLVVVLLSAATIERWMGASETPEREHRTGHVEWIGVGNRTIVVTTLDELERRYEVGVGSLVLDLSQLDLTGQERHVHVEVGAGEVSVIVPSGASLAVRGEIGAGSAHVLGHAIEGADARIEQDDAGARKGALHLQLEVGVGKVEVRRHAGAELAPQPENAEEGL